MRKTILCYGDSNTFGHDPATNCRFDEGTRWPGVLQAALGTDWRVIEEGLNHRTTCLDDPYHEGRNGSSYLVPCLESHRPLDLVIIMLGSNDTKTQYNLPASSIADGVGVLVDTARRADCGRDGKAPAILILPPPLPGRLSEYAELHVGIEEKMPRLATLYEAVALEKGCLFLNVQTFLRCPDTDGIHLDAEGHRRIGQAVAALIESRRG